MAETGTKSGLRYNPPTVRSWIDEGNFVVPEVIYRGKTEDYFLFEQMTPAMNQDTLIEFYERERQAGNPVPTDAPLLWAIATRGYELRDEMPEDARRLQKLLRNGFRKFPNTLTRIHYSPDSDSVLHNVGTSDQYDVEGKVVGLNGWIHKISDKEVLERILGTSDIEKMDEVSQWFNGTNMYFWRLNSKPKQLEKRVAGFNTGVGRLGLYCGRDPHIECPAFRVLQID